LASSFFASPREKRKDGGRARSAERSEALRGFLAVLAKIGSEFFIKRHKDRNASHTGGFLLCARPQVYFCFREAKGKNTEAGIAENLRQEIYPCPHNEF
jgi:hypothetical protein